MTNQIEIASCSTYLPKQKVVSDDFFDAINLYKDYGIPNNWMSRIMGIKEKRRADINQQPSDLAYEAAMKCINKISNFDIAEIDALIFCGIEKDQKEPATAHNVQRKLGTNAKYVFDVSNACFGFFDGIELGEMFIKTKKARNVLVVTGETYGRLHDAIIKKMEKGAEVSEIKKLIGFFSIADAGGAMLLSRTNSKKTGFRFFKNKVNSEFSECCYYKMYGDKVEGQMLMSEIMDKGFEMQESSLEKNMHSVGWDEFDWLLTHQTGRKNYEQTQNLNVSKPERVIKTFDKLGNVTSATLPIVFEEMQKTGLLKKGDNVGGAFAGSGLIIGQFGYTV